MQHLSEPLVINLVVYKNRDDLLYRELVSVPPKYRAERLRNLATMTCFMGPLLGRRLEDLEVLREVVPYASSASADPAGEPESTEAMSLKLTINAYNYPELYRDLSRVPSGSVSSRVKLLSAIGVVMARLARALPSDPVFSGQRQVPPGGGYSPEDAEDLRPAEEPSPRPIDSDNASRAGDDAERMVKDSSDRPTDESTEGGLEKRERRGSAINKIRM